MLKVLKWVGGIILVGYIALVVGRAFYLEGQDRTKEQVAKIHATKLSLDDVMGKNLPLDPGADVDKTVQGIDANTNGIRDDVELAIFKEYPDSAKKRLPLLQYALVLQKQATLPIVNGETVTATVEDKSRAELCLWTLSSRADLKKFLSDMDRYQNFVTELQFNTEERKSYRDKIYEYLGSYSASSESCDLDPSELPN